MYSSMLAVMAGIFICHALVIPALFKNRSFKWGWVNGIFVALIFAGLWMLGVHLGYLEIRHE